MGYDFSSSTNSTTQENEVPVEIAAAANPPTSVAGEATPATSAVGETAPVAEPVESPYDKLSTERTQALPTAAEVSNYVKSKDSDAVAKGESFITPESTVAGQLEKIFDNESPLYKLTETNSRARAAALGMGSSSAAVGAGISALYQTGLEIAQPDAAAAASLKLQEQQAANRKREIDQEALVSGDLNVQKARIANEQAALSESFTIKLEGLKAADQVRLTNIQAQNNLDTTQLKGDLDQVLSDSQMDAQTKQTITNFALDATNNTQTNINYLLTDAELMKSMGEYDKANDLPDGTTLTE